MKASCFNDDNFIHIYSFFSLIFTNELRFLQVDFQAPQPKAESTEYRCLNVSTTTMRIQA